MPKVVDWNKSKTAIAQAVWRVIQTQGSQHLSVRTIAQEANMPVGTLRHYFPTQAELLVFSMQLAADQVRERVSNVPNEGSSIELLRGILQQFLPLDSERQLEMEVWLYFVSEANHNNAMRKLRTQTQEEVHKLIAMLLRHVGTSHLTDHADCEARRLQALVDGLALHYLALQTKASKKEIIDVLDYHLQALTTYEQKQ